jgi:hypothetical protein
MNSRADHIFCCIRRRWVLPLPEEVVRQCCLKKMIEDLGYPSGGFALEQSLRQMPHLALSSVKFPSRRADIVFFTKDIHVQHEFYPLLLIECKAVPLTEKVIRQVVGYNFYVQAPFVALVNMTESYTGHYDQGKGAFQFEPGLLSFRQLLDQWHAHSKKRT